MARVLPRHVHKPGMRDVVIANIRRHSTEPRTYEADFVQPPPDHFLSWPSHFKHVEGMALIEAIQQTAKAAKKIFERDQRKGYYFTGISDLRFRKLLPKYETAIIRIALRKSREVKVSPRGKKPVKATYPLVEASIIDSSVQVVASGKGHAVIYNSRARVW